MHGMVGSVSRLEFEFLNSTCGTPAVKVKSAFESTVGWKPEPVMVSL